MVHSKLRTRFQRIYYFVTGFLLFGLNLLQTTTVLALDECQSRQFGVFSQQEIEFYDGCSCSDTSHTADSNGNDVYMIGDSITVLSQNDIRKELPGITIDAISGTWFSNSAGGESGVSRISKMGNQPILVFAMGTNGGVTQDDITQLFNALEGKDVKVILMSLYYNNPGSASQMESSNKVIQETVEKNENVSLMDWYAVASADPENILADAPTAEDPDAKDNVHPSSPTGTQKFAETVKKAVDEISIVNVEAAGGATGDLSAIMSAKNADQSVFNVSSDDPWRMHFLDNDTSTMKHLLETYGDLAYQTGQAIGAPWIAILVQGRYEDSWSRCGKNNFWGNGCYGAGHLCDGCSRIQGQTLGEGFTQYAQTATNGNHHFTPGSSAIDYLLAIEGTWIGDGSVYSDGWDKSIKALEDYVATPEGQAIVQQFGNYHGSTSGGTQCCLTGRTSPYDKNTSNVKWDDGWIVSGINGFYRDSLEDLPQQETWGADYLTDSLSSQHTGKGPNKILLHATEGDSDGGDSVHYIYKGQTSVPGNKGKSVPPHFTIDIKNKKLYQHQSIWKASAGIKSDEDGNGDLTAGIQIEIVGFDDGTSGEWDLTKTENFSDEDWKYLIDLLNAISAETSIPLESTVNWGEGNSVRMTDLGEFKNYQGILAHKHAPLNDHGDITEGVWKRIDSALQKYANASSGICGPTGDVASLQATVLDFAWPEHHDPVYLDKKPKYIEAVNRSSYVGGCSGADCGAFVTILMHESGWDPNYNSGNGPTGTQIEYLRQNWTEVTGTIKSNEDAKPGDVLIYSEGANGHTLVYVGEIAGFGSKMASASLCLRAPMADSAKDISYYINSSGHDYHVFRKTK